MYSLLKSRLPSSQKVTFPVNALLLKGSVGPLTWLCEQFDASLTIWQNDPQSSVDLKELVYIRMKLPKNKVYYDLQEETMTKFIEIADDQKTLTEGEC